MLKELRFVQGAVAKKDFMPAMTHFVIEDGAVRAYNGSLALCAPIAFNIDCKPKAAALVNAIAQCTDTDENGHDYPIQLAMTPAGRLRIACGQFKAFVDCIAEETPHVQPEGERVDFDGETVLRALKVVQPFIGDDASRQWCNGVLMRGQSVFATNNVVAVEYWTEATMPVEINIPRAAVAEMLRINEPPTHAQVTENSVTFHYTDKRWIRSQLLGLEWPDIGKLFANSDNATAIDKRIFDGLEKLKRFVDKAGRVFIGSGTLRTAPGEKEDEGARFEIPGLECEGIYNIEMLMLLRNVATHIDFSTYPAPSVFYGERLRGALVGMRM